eukprot:TRINITY_DN9594_c0_g2_i1.p2 TRINITY_DN9594_c0_g2~~TRINITY_DN9594_c0_g2_i1.p2  ORF type:complete len:119 (+),score=23.01 TRINITY_DN9594_c0_g2_i1:71-427(+)
MAKMKKIQNIKSKKKVIEKFRKNSDFKTAELLENVVYKEEISHCAAGVRWLKWLYEQAAENEAVGEWADEARNFKSVEEWFHHLTRSYFNSQKLKPPFNDEARTMAGFGKEWYMPLCT